MKPTLLLAEPHGFSLKAKSLLASHFTLKEGPLKPKELPQALKAVDVLWIRFGHTITKKTITHALNLKAIVCNATGTDHLDEKAISKQNIALLSLKGETEFLKTVSSTAEHHFGLVLSLIRKIPSATQLTQKGKWDRTPFQGEELQGKVFGILGLGRIGVQVARFAQAFGMQVIAFDPKPKEIPTFVRTINNLSLFLNQTQILSIHLPLQEDTQSFLSQKNLSLLPRKAYLINTSRGAILDEKALLKFLKNGHLAGAALDVLANEKAGWEPKTHHPLVRFAKQNPEKLILTPHLAGNTLQAWEKTEVFMAQKLLKFFSFI